MKYILIFLSIIHISLIAHTKNTHSIRAIVLIEDQEVNCQLFFSTELLAAMIPIETAMMIEEEPQNKTHLNTLSRYLKDKNFIYINKILVAPILKTIVIQDGFIKLIVSYPCAIPETLKIDWNLYPIDILGKKWLEQVVSVNVAHNERMLELQQKDKSQLQDMLLLSAVKIVVKAIEETPREVTFSKEKSVFIWKPQKNNKIELLKVPKNKQQQLILPLWLLMLTLLMGLIGYLLYKKIAFKNVCILVIMGLIAVALFIGEIIIIPWSEELYQPTSKEAIDIFKVLHQNIYRSFDYTNKNDIYDALEQSVSGKLLVDVYREVYASLLARNKQGSQTLIKAINIHQAKVLPGTVNTQQFIIQCQWQVEGFVIHNGHMHVRINEYEAIYTIDNIQGIWKITKSQILNQRREE